MDDYSAWVGRSETREDVATAAPLAGLAALLDHDVPPWTAGTVPPLGHWLYFLPATRQSAIGEDGHPRRDGHGLLPPVPLPRRMWAGSRFTFDGEPVRLGETIERRSTIKSVAPKTGSTGSMVFVTVQHMISGPRGPSVIEEHDIVYREAAKPGETPKPPKAAPTDATWSKAIPADPVLLFRFSALTFNGHRIHYDQPYVTGIEGYPGLIVHGPLMGLVQMELARRSNPARIARSFEFRALSPVFAGGAFSVHARREEEGSITTWVADQNGGLAQQGGATFQ